jgi:hypothetical protein
MRLSKSPKAARKMLNRDCLYGILRPVFPLTWPRSYELVLEHEYRKKNVTLSSTANSNTRCSRQHTCGKKEIRAQLPIENTPNTPFDSNSSLLQCSVPTNTIALVSDTDRLSSSNNNELERYLFNHAKRQRRYYNKKRLQLYHSCFYKEAICKVASRVNDAVLVHDAAGGRRGGGGGGLLLFKAHNLSFALQTSPDSVAAASLNAGRQRKGKGGRFFVGGSVSMKGGVVDVSYKFYPKSGYVQIQPEMSASPIEIVSSSLRSFVEEIRATLPFESPGTDSWLITLADIHIPDWDVTDQQNEPWVKALDAVPLFRKLKDGSTTFHAYAKTYGGRTWVRTELLQERPDMTLSDFVRTYIDQDLAGSKFTEALLALLS